MSSKVGIAICDMDTNCIKNVNSVFISIFEKDEKELIGKPIDTIFSIDENIYLKDFNNSKFSNISDFSFETKYAKKIETIRLFVHFTIIDNERLLVHIIDLSNNNYSKDELLTLTENIPGFTYKYQYKASTSKERFLYASKGVKDIYGISINEALHDISLIRKQIHPEDIESFKKNILHSSETLEPFHQKFRINHPQKGLLWLETKSIPKKDSINGDVIWHGITMDITEQKRTEDKLKESEKKYRTLVENAKIPIYRFDKNFKRAYVNSEVEKLVGKSYSELIGKSPFELKLIEDDSIDDLKKAFNKVFETKDMTSVELKFILANNTRKYFMHNLIPEFDDNGEVESILAISIDLTAQKELALREKEFRTLAENSPNIIMRYDLNGNRVYANRSFSEQTGIPYELIINNKPIKQWGVYLDMLNMSAYEYHEKINKVIKTAENECFTVEWIRKDDCAYIAHDLCLVAETDDYKNIIGVLAIGHNITDRKNVEKRIEYMAHHDALTSLPNRILLKDKSEQILYNAKNLKKEVAVLFIDLDGFKNVNDTLGHSIGDIMLQMVAVRLQTSIRKSDILSRQGGDEFVLILSEINDRNDIKNIANKLLEKFKKSFNINNNTISISASIGISIYPEHGDSLEQLLQSADVAMYKAKESGKNTYCFYNHKIKHNLMGFLKMQNELKDAVKNGEFILHYQPQIDLRENKIIGVEALLRWQHPILGKVPPIDFIAIAESTGLIVEIGEWVLIEACKQTALWNSKGKDLVIAVNISAIQFKRGNLIDIIKKVLRISGLNPKYLELELTESILIQDTEIILNMLKDIKELGIKLSIDDFGTGYSSLAYLKRFAVDKLKIDQSFVKGMINNKEDADIVKTIIQIAKSFNLKSIAEGVEDKDVLTLINEFGCDEAQGYYFAKPMNSKDFEDYFENKFPSLL